MNTTELIQFLTSLLSILRFNIYGLSEDNRQILILQVDLLNHFENIFKSYFGDTAFLQLKQNIEYTRAQFKIKPIEFVLNDVTVGTRVDQLTNEVISSLTNILLPQPQITNIDTYYDITLGRPVIVITLANTQLVGGYYEITYWQLDKPDIKYTLTSPTELIVILNNLVPNKTYGIKIRAKSYLLYSDYVYTEVVTAKDNTIPQRPVIKQIVPTYRGTTVIFETPQDYDFDHYEVSFVLENTPYTFTTKTNVLYIYLNKLFTSVAAYAYTVDTSGNISEPVEITLSLLDFSQAERELADRIENAFTFKTTQVTVNTVNGKYITLSKDNQQYIPHQTALLYDDANKHVYNILLIHEYGVIELHEPFSNSVGLTLTVVPSIYSLHILQQITADAIVSLIQNTTNRQFELTQFVLDDTSIVVNDNSIDFTNNSSTYYTLPNYVVIFQSGQKYFTSIVKEVYLKRLVVNGIPNFQPTKITVRSPESFVSSNILQMYDKIVQSVIDLEFQPILTATVVSVNNLVVTFNKTLANIDINSIVKLTKNGLTWYYDISIVYTDSIVVTDLKLLDYFVNGTLEFYSRSNIRLSVLLMTQSQISTLVTDMQKQLQSELVQLADQIQMRVVLKDSNGNVVPTELLVQNGKIVANTDKFIISGDLIVSGTIDASKVSILAGNTVIDGSGIQLKQGQILLGQKVINNQVTYGVKLSDDGSGHLAQGQISWDSEGNLHIQPTGNSIVKIDANKFILTNNNVQTSFMLDENGRFVFDGNIIIRNGSISFNLLDPTVQETLNKLKEYTERMYVVIDALDGTFIDLYKPSIRLRLRVFVGSEEININDTNGGQNMFLYKWYIDGVHKPAFDGLVEIVIDADMIATRALVECELTPL